MDSVQFALGMLNFDVALHQPQPPGYFLYVLMGRAAMSLTDDANTALVSIGILFSGLAVVMLYILATDLFGRNTGLVAGVLGVTSPLVWFHGEVALSYMPEAFMSLLVAWLCLRAVRSRDVRYLVAVSVALGVAGGIRQNTMVFLAPLWLYTMSGFGLRRVAFCSAVLALTIAAWFFPMLAETGGYERYSAALEAHWLDANWRGINLSWVAFNAKYMAYFILSGLTLATVPLADFTIGAVSGRTTLPANSKTSLFFALWLMPSFLFHLIIFTHPAVPGHSLIYVVGLIILAARAADYTAARMTESLAGVSVGITRAAVVGVIAAVNVYFFILAPYPLSVKGVTEHDRILSSYIDTIKSRFSPEDTLIIGTNRFLYSYRHAMYYLPEFKVYNTVLITTPEGKRLFWGRNMATHKARLIEPDPGAKRFVDFLNYNESQRNGLPAEAIIDDIGGGNLLVHYEGISGLYKVDRIAPLIPHRL